MSALTEIFNHFYAYLIVFLVAVLGFDNDTIKNEAVKDIVNDIVLTITSNLTPEQLDNFLKIRPILCLSIGIFACGAVIRLFHKLIR